MLRRLAIALTTLLSLVGVVVVAGYLLIFAAGSDRAAASVPADAAAYVSAYLQPTTGQQLNLAAMLGHVPGFEDAAGLDQKLNEISARFLGMAGIDYEADVRPWLGNQLAAAAFGGDTLDAPRLLLVVAVKDPAAAHAALPRLAAGRGLTPRTATYQGTQISVDPTASWALLDDQLLIATDQATLEAALDAATDRRPSLADDAGFNAAMRRLPPDHLASAYVNLHSVATGVDMVESASGYATLAVAVIAEPDGLRLEGSAPFNRDAASEEARRGFDLGTQVATVTEWMPADTQASAVVFGLHGILADAERGLAGQPAAGDIVTSLNQLRALAGFGLGINLDQDVLPLLDGEAGLAIGSLFEGAPHGQLVVRPPDPAAASTLLNRLRGGLQGLGATVSERAAGTTTVVSVTIPQVGAGAWAVEDGAVIIGLGYDDVAAAVQAHQSGQSLADSASYAGTWQLAGDRGGNELFVDIGSIADGSPDSLGMTGDARDILLSISALGLTVPARDDTSQLRAALTVR
ncbi:MAG TPA: DUF3352 domain-containing protein [Candidatus Limnocylindria bacterium]